MVHPLFVTPAKAGVQERFATPSALYSRFRGNDDFAVTLTSTGSVIDSDASRV